MKPRAGTRIILHARTHARLRHHERLSRVQAFSASTSSIHSLPVGLLPFQTTTRARTYASVAAINRSAPETAVDTRMAALSPLVDGSESIIKVLDGISGILRNDVGGSGVWLDRVEEAAHDLGRKRRARIAVFGDALTGSRDVVSAILQDPLTDSDTEREAILNRYFGTSDEILHITHSEEFEREERSLKCSSSWLQSSQLEMVEIQATGETALSSLIAADIVVIVLDPIRLASAHFLQDVLPMALTKCKVHFVINGPLRPSSSEESIKNSLDLAIKDIPGLFPSHSSYDVSFVQADRALSSLSALSKALGNDISSSADKTEAFDQYQRDFLASNIGPLQASLSSHNESSFQLATAISNAELALKQIDAVVAIDRDVVRTASDVIDKLRRDAAQQSSKARRLSVVSRGIQGGDVEGSVKNSLDQSRHDIQQIFDGRLSWLGLIARLRVDDVGAEIGSYLSSMFAKDVERQLVFEAGELSELQSTLSSSADKTVRQLMSRQTDRAGHPFSSPLLLNHLSSFSLSVPPFVPTSLLPPLLSRRQQLLATAVPRLQVAAQHSLLSTYAFALLGVSSSWVGYMPPVEYFSGGTAVGLGALSVVSSLALGQVFWARAQNRFWKDWARVTDMLKSDLADFYEQSVDSLVLAKPKLAADGLAELVAKREARLAELESRLAMLRSQLPSKHVINK